MTSTLGSNVAATQLGVGTAPDQVTAWFQQQLVAALADPLFNLPKVFLTYMSDYISTSGLAIPFGQIIGALNFVPNQSTGTNAFSGTLAGGASTSGAGPSIAGLGAGAYFLLAGYVGTADATVVAGSVDVKAAGSTVFTVSGSGIGSAGNAVAASFAAFGFTLLSGAADITSSYSVTNAAGTNRNWSIANMQIAAIKTANA